MEYRFADEQAHVSTEEFHKDRARANHLEQPEHKSRLIRASEFVNLHVSKQSKVVDLGCGDGGLLSLLQSDYKVWGYDFQPANVKAAVEERALDVKHLNIVEDIKRDNRGNYNADVAIMTEMIEHLDDPHLFLDDLYYFTDIKSIVCSSPFTEIPEAHDPLHVWGWDFAGYESLLRGTGWIPIRHEAVDRFQLIYAERI